MKEKIIGVGFSGKPNDQRNVIKRLKDVIGGNESVSALIGFMGPKSYLRHFYLKKYNTKITSS